MAKVEIKIVYDSDRDNEEQLFSVGSVDSKRGLKVEDRFLEINKRQAKKRSGAKKIIHGVKSIAKSIAGVGWASDEDVAMRREMCSNCEFRKGKSCGKCGCHIGHKTRLASEECPMLYWGKVEVKS